jgi:hypothetical protein
MPFPNPFKSSPWTELNQADWIKELKKLNQFKQLHRLIGDAHAANVALAFFNKFSSHGKASFRTENKATYWTEMGRMVQHEMNCVLQGNYYVGKLQIMARMGNFRSTYATQTLAAADYGARDTDSDLDKATSWIVYTSNSLRRVADDADAPVNRAKIRQALQDGSQRDVRSEQTLRWLHTKLVNQATLKPTRGPAAEAPYPSTGGAGFLLEHTFDLAQGITLPPARDPKWFDLACYLFGAVVRSHGFTDGNGRVGRGAYALAMLAGQIPFVALSAAAEKAIHGLESVS